MAPAVQLIVIAGGRGQRAGGCIKPLLRRGKHTLLELALAMDPDQEALIVAPADLQHQLQPFAQQARWIVDPGKGPGLALLCAAQASQAEQLMVMGGDHPYPSAALAKRLLKAANGHSAWVVDGAPQPLGPSVVHRRRLLLPFSGSNGTTELAEGTLAPGLISLIRQTDPAEVPVHLLSERERQSLIDVDTTGDIAQHQLKEATSS